jgi:CubicO group peptidase (beta-lactamase class C family)
LDGHAWHVAFKARYFFRPPVPEDPQGDFTAIGVWGQYIYVDPNRELIVVKTSADPDFDNNDHESIAVFREIARTVAGSGP